MTDNIVSHAINSVEATRVFKTEKMLDPVTCLILMSKKVGVKESNDRDVLSNIPSICNYK